MRITINVKPNVIKGTSKADILSKAGLGGWIVDSNGSRFSHLKDYGGRMGDNSIYAVNFEKHRKIVKVAKSGNRKVLVKGHWIAYVYNFTKYAKFVKINQGTRNFSFVIK